jgi:polyisoprenoid-binding protein YceI
MGTKTNWVIDPGHSEIQFKVKHLAIANVAGTFKTFSGHAVCDGDLFAGAIISFEMDAASIDTNNIERDKHLRSDVFLNAEKFPKITFGGVITQEEDDYRLTGDLTLLSTTKRISLNVKHTGTGIGRFNDTRAGFEITSKINRKDFGLDFNLLTEMGSLVVGDEIRIHGDIELIKKQ